MGKQEATLIDISTLARETLDWLEQRMIAKDGGHVLQDTYHHGLSSRLHPLLWAFLESEDTPDGLSACFDAVGWNEQLRMRWADIVPATPGGGPVPYVSQKLAHEPERVKAVLVALRLAASGGG